MDLDEADASHALEICVEGPNPSALVSGNGSDQEVRETVR
jgi:hypothetical protein